MSQQIEITASSGLSGLVGKLFADGSDTVAATSSGVTEATNRKSTYVATFTGVTIGTYQLLLLDADSLPVASRTVRVTAADGLFTEIGEEAQQVAAIRSGLATSQNVTDAAQSVIDHGDGEGAWGATGSEGGEAPTIIVAVSIPAIEAESIVLDQEVTKYRGTLWAFTVEGLVSIPAKAYWTIKRSTETDAKAALQVVARNPSVDGDGLKILNGAAVLPADASRGSITYESYTVSGNTRYRAILRLLPTASAAILPDFYKLDLKDVTSDADAIIAECVLRVVNPVTLATS